MSHGLKILFRLFAICIIFVAGCGKSQEATIERTEEPGQSGTEATTPEEDVTSVESVAPAEDTITDDGTVPSGEPETTITELKIGDPAPELAIASWVKGDEVTGFQDDHIYVIEFWATWCGPCRVSMPHLSELQQHLGDQATFIGISNETEDIVQGFLDEVQNEETGETWNDIVSYTIALDADRTTGDAYMRAAGQSGIPTAFIVGRSGRIEWIGHPMGMDDPIEKIVANQWDLEAEAARFAEEQRSRQAYQAASRAIRQARQDGNWDAALEVINGLIAEFPSQAAFQMLKIQSLQNAGRAEEIGALAEQVAEENWENASLLNQLSWLLATSVPEPHQSLDLAMRIAKQASALKDDGDASILDTVARVYYEQGDLNQAIEWQRKAIDSGGASSQIRRALEKYESELAAASEAETDVEPETETVVDADAGDNAAESVEETTQEEPAEENVEGDAEESVEGEAEEGADADNEDPAEATPEDENGDEGPQPDQ